MSWTTRVVTGALVACAVGQSAYGAFVGGAFVSMQSWNDAATAAIGQQASVYRLYFAFSVADLSMIGVNNVTIANVGGDFYQDPFGGDLQPNLGFEPLSPGVRWDTHLGVGTLYQPTESFLLGDIAFGDRTLDAEEGWQTWVADGEGVVVPPGALDVNGDEVVPASFDPAYRYAFAGQFTLLDYAADTTRSIVFDGGYVDGAGVFGGQINLQFVIPASGGSGTDVVGIQIIPAPGAASTLAIGLLAVRRRRPSRR